MTPLKHDGKVQLHDVDVHECTFSWYYFEVSKNMQHTCMTQLALNICTLICFIDKESNLTNMKHFNSNLTWPKT